MDPAHNPAVACQKLRVTLPLSRIWVLRGPTMWTLTPLREHVPYTETFPAKKDAIEVMCSCLVHLIDDTSVSAGLLRSVYPCREKGYKEITFHRLPIQSVHHPHPSSSTTPGLALVPLTSTAKHNPTRPGSISTSSLSHNDFDSSIRLGRHLAQPSHQRQALPSP